jgi:hypothetical protein
MSRFVDVTGQRFGRLFVLERATNRYGRACFLCMCDCGKQAIAYGGALRTGFKQSCGCLRKEASVRQGLNNAKHGHARVGRMTPEYRSYVGARRRCTNRNDSQYSNYGGRGIEVRFASFAEFYVELGAKPEPKHLYSVDRIDNDGHYEKGNVRWATRSQQMRNRRPGFNQGQKHPGAKLTEVQVIEIRKRAGSESNKALADEFGVDYTNIRLIANGKTWQHVGKAA